MIRMMFQKSLLSSIKELFHENTVISISGKAGTGKTSLSLQFVGEFLTFFTPFEGKCVWIQASEQFSKKRLESLFRRNSEKLRYLIQNIFITPKDGPFTSYDIQLEALKNLTENDNYLPPDLKFIVIDNISHHLRYKISRITDISLKFNIINKFYDNILTPLIFWCHREKTNLILIHEVSFDTYSEETRPFFSKLYERIRGLHITLSRSLFSNQRTMDIAFKDILCSFKFQITDQGFTFSK